MSRGGFRGKKRLPGAEFSWETEGGGDIDTGPQPLFPVSRFAKPFLQALASVFLPRASADFGMFFI